jgi:hypothetical protein
MYYRKRGDPEAGTSSTVEKVALPSTALLALICKRSAAS